MQIYNICANPQDVMGVFATTLGPKVVAKRVDGDETRCVCVCVWVEGEERKGGRG